MSVIDTATNTVIGDLIPTGTRTGLAVSPDGARVYVPSGFGDEFALSVISIGSNTVDL